MCWQFGIQINVKKHVERCFPIKFFCFFFVFSFKMNENRDLNAKEHPMATTSDRAQLASTTSTGHVRIWDPVKNECLCTLKPRGERVKQLKWTRNGTWLICTSVDGRRTVWDTTLIKYCLIARREYSRTRDKEKALALIRKGKNLLQKRKEEQR